jgi:hypothetical protein
MIPRKTRRGVAALALLFCLGCAPTRTNTVEAPVERPETSTKAGAPPGNAFAALADNTSALPWTISQTRPGPEPAFGEGDRVKVKSGPDGVTMTVEYVHPLTYVSGPYAFDSDDPVFKIRYRCRWENKDGSEAVGDFREEELEPASVAGRR